MTNPTDDVSTESPAQVTGEQPAAAPAPLPWRKGLTVTVAALALFAAFALGAALSGEPPQKQDPITVTSTIYRTETSTTTLQPSRSRRYTPSRSASPTSDTSPERTRPRPTDDEIPETP
ncbi:MAG: hypothetical protein QM774_06430 [Gordonia sp. (in: high G+C Gram-positive bacteria)]|uniref:hypothetical protein n=1 Tax=Gordonia sp. (in: high G+C Gram-positive bacteria) TaxID=84139 RepID=UPI0039E32A0D